MTGKATKSKKKKTGLPTKKKHFVFKKPVGFSVAIIRNNFKKLQKNFNLFD